MNPNNESFIVFSINELSRLEKVSMAWICPCGAKVSNNDERLIELGVAFVSEGNRTFASRDETTQT
jgi:hypothetical protein